MMYIVRQFVEAKFEFFVSFEIVKPKRSKVRDQYVLGQLVRQQNFAIVERLSRCLVKIPTERLMLDQQDATPKKVYRTSILIIFRNDTIKDRDLAAFDTENLQKLVPKRLRFGTFSRLTFPLMDRGDRIISYFGLG